MPLPLFWVAGGAVLAAGYFAHRQKQRQAAPSQNLADDGADWAQRLTRARSAERWNDVAHAHRRLADFSRGDERVSHLLRAGRIYEDRLGDAEAASRCYEDVLGTPPHQSAALAGIEFLRG